MSTKSLLRERVVQINRIMRIGHLSFENLPCLFGRATKVEDDFGHRRIQRREVRQTLNEVPVSVSSDRATSDGRC